MNECNLLRKDGTPRVVVTGLGAVTAFGLGVPVLWEALTTGKPGIGQITQFDTTGFVAKIAGEIKDWDPGFFLDSKEARRLARFQQFGVAAALDACDDAGLEITDANADRVGVIVGSGIGGLEIMEQQSRVLAEDGPDRVSPFLVPMMLVDLVAGHISMRLGARGPNWSPVSACATGSHAIGEGFETVRRGAADVCFVGASEAAITFLGVAGFRAARALCTSGNDEPTKASRPFDQSHDGFVMAEGAGVLVIETLEHALARDAEIYCEVLGYGASGDAYHITASHPEGRGARMAMLLALAEAGIRAGDVDYVNAHGTSTPLGDEAELKAIRSVFGDDAGNLTMSSTKSMTGHLLGAAGAVEAIATAMAVSDGVCPPTINLENPCEGAVGWDLAAGEAREREVKYALSNSFGFGGHNATLVFGRCEH